MDLDLNTDQHMFRETSARFMQDQCPLTKVRALAEHATGVEPDYITQAAELGWFSLLVPEDLGGGTLGEHGLLDAVIVAEELGKAMQPGPFLPHNVVIHALAESGSAQQQADILPALMAGEQLASWTLATPAGNWDLDNNSVTVSEAGDSYVLNGAKGFVQDAHLADWLLVTAPVAGGLGQFLVAAKTPGVRLEALTSFDLGRRFSHVHFADVAVPASALVGIAGAAADAVERQFQIALALQNAETLGLMEWLFTAMVDYSRERIAFGRPIGSFQALKHIMADQALVLETCRAGAAALARVVAEQGEDAAEVASMTKAFIGEQAVEMAQQSLQIHGGIGCTWEFDLHLFLRRASVNSALYGAPGWHRERLCRYHGL